MGEVESNEEQTPPPHPGMDKGRVEGNPGVVVNFPIDGRIGTDEAELKVWASRVIAGTVIHRMEIADLRALVRAVQQHPDAVLAPRNRGLTDHGQPVTPEPTQLVLSECTIKHADFHGQAKDGAWTERIRINLAIMALFDCYASFQDVHFDGMAMFDGSRFRGDISFYGAQFADDAGFSRCQFERQALFGRCTFLRGASFYDTMFRQGSNFEASQFMTDAIFLSCRFNGWHNFSYSRFFGAANFSDAAFEAPTEFNGAHFLSQSIWTRASFSGLVSFSAARFESNADFDSIRALGELRFNEATFGGPVDFSDSIFAHGACFDLAHFHASTKGDMRGVNVRSAIAAIAGKSRRRNQRFGRARWAIRFVLGLLQRAFVYGPIGWDWVRSLGGLNLLNRASLVVLIAVPILAALFVALQHSLAAHASDALWPSVLSRVVGDHPHISETLAVAFFGSVFVTLGLLVYQVFADDIIKERTIAQHIEDVDSRYPEDSVQRDDGLRRSLERLVDQSKVRSGSHPNFVAHHGDLIWMPPQDKLSWFRDQGDRELSIARTLVQQRNEVRGHEPKLPPPSNPIDREGFVPGAERARICIEEGAKAEYWLLSHKRVWAAWISFLLYLAGIGCILWVLGLQCNKVGQAAGWWGQPVALVAPSPSAPQ